MQPAIEACGVISRILFFVAVFAGLIEYASDAAWRREILSTRFADLTFGLVFESVCMSALLLGAVCVFGAWALASGPKNYKAWAKLGFLYVAFIVVWAALVWHKVGG